MLNPYSVVHQGRYLTMLTSGFIHADWGHLLFNMISFFYFGFPLEKVFCLPELGGKMGHILFAVLYLGSMILADISTVIRRRNNPNYYSLGASGAISGILFSFILFFPFESISILFIPIPIPAPIFAVLYVVFSIYSSRRNNTNINHDAHLWGALAGVIITLIFFPKILPEFLDNVRILTAKYF